jgi:hypothetical protein
MYDADVEVRGTAVAQIGHMARRFHAQKQQNELDKVLPYLVNVLRKTQEDRTRAMVAGVLIEIGRADLGPEEVMSKVKSSEWQ